MSPPTNHYLLSRHLTHLIILWRELITILSIPHLLLLLILVNRRAYPIKGEVFKGRILPLTRLRRMNGHPREFRIEVGAALHSVLVLTQSRFEGRLHLARVQRLPIHGIEKPVRLHTRRAIPRSQPILWISLH